MASKIWQPVLAPPTAERDYSAAGNQVLTALLKSWKQMHPLHPGVFRQMEQDSVLQHIDRTQLAWGRPSTPTLGPDNIVISETVQNSDDTQYISRTQLALERAIPNLGPNNIVISDVAQIDTPPLNRTQLASGRSLMPNFTQNHDIKCETGKNGTQGVKSTQLAWGRPPSVFLDPNYTIVSETVQNTTEEDVQSNDQLDRDNLRLILPHRQKTDYDEINEPLPSRKINTSNSGDIATKVSRRNVPRNGTVSKKIKKILQPEINQMNTRIENERDTYGIENDDTTKNHDLIRPELRALNSSDVSERLELFSSIIEANNTILNTSKDVTEEKLIYVPNYTIEKLQKEIKKAYIGNDTLNQNVTKEFALLNIFTESDSECVIQNITKAHDCSEPQICVSRSNVRQEISKKNPTQYVPSNLTVPAKNLEKSNNTAYIKRNESAPHPPDQKESTNENTEKTVKQYVSNNLTVPAKNLEKGNNPAYIKCNKNTLNHSDREEPTKENTRLKFDDSIQVYPYIIPEPVESLPPNLSSKCNNSTSKNILDNEIVQRAEDNFNLMHNSHQKVNMSDHFDLNEGTKESTEINMTKLGISKPLMNVTDPNIKTLKEISVNKTGQIGNENDIKTVLKNSKPENATVNIIRIENYPDVLDEAVLKGYTPVNISNTCIFMNDPKAYGRSERSQLDFPGVLLPKRTSKGTSGQKTIRISELRSKQEQPKEKNLLYIRSCNNELKYSESTESNRSGIVNPTNAGTSKEYLDKRTGSSNDQNSPKIFMKNSQQDHTTPTENVTEILEHTKSIADPWYDNAIFLPEDLSPPNSPKFQTKNVGGSLTSNPQEDIKPPAAIKSSIPVANTNRKTKVDEGKVTRKREMVRTGVPKANYHMEITSTEPVKSPNRKQCKLTELFASAKCGTRRETFTKMLEQFRFVERDDGAEVAGSTVNGGAPVSCIAMNNQNGNLKVAVDGGRDCTGNEGKNKKIYDYYRKIKCDRRPPVVLGTATNPTRLMQTELTISSPGSGSRTTLKYRKKKYDSEYLVEVEGVKYTVRVLTEEKCQELQRKLISDLHCEIGFNIIYQEGFSQLDRPLAKGKPINPRADGLLVSCKWPEERDCVHLVPLRADPAVRDLLGTCLTRARPAATFGAQELFTVLADTFGFARRDVALRWTVIDVAVGCWLMDADRPILCFSDALTRLKVSAAVPPADADLAHPVERGARYLLALSPAARQLQRCLQENHLWTLFIDIEMKLASVLAVMTQRGIKTDRNLFLHMEQLLAGSISKVEEAAFQAAGKKFKINSTVELRSILYNELKLDKLIPMNIKKTDCLQAKSTSEAMLKLLKHVHQLPGLISEYRHLHKLQSTYVEAMLKHCAGGFVYTTWDQTAAATGRLASNHPNLQAIPKHAIQLPYLSSGKHPEQRSVSIWLRAPFIARDGYTFLAIDFQHIELRLFAHLSQDPNLQYEFQHADEDIFSALAAQWRGMPRHQIHADDRDRTKRIVYAIMYGAGIYKLAQDLEMTYEEASNVYKAFIRRYPTLKTYSMRVLDECRLSGLATTLSGRRRLFPNIHSENPSLRAQAERQAVNFTIQGSAADVCKVAMLQTEQAFALNPNLECHLLLQIHDELVWEVTDDALPHVTDILRGIFADFAGRNCFHITVPLPVVLTEGKCWAHMSKINC